MQIKIKMNNGENVSLSKSIRDLSDDINLKKIKFRDIEYNDSKEKIDESKKKLNKSAKKKRKKKRKLLKQLESQVAETLKDNLFNSTDNKPSNPYRLFLLYKLRKKYDAKINIYDLKKVNELIFNIPSHFTAIFKEYLLKEEEAEFLKRIYFRNEINKKLKNIFYFYDKYSKIFPNYIVIPEGHHLYKNILKKQKMIDKLQKIKEEEMKNKQILLEGSFNTVFSNGAIDSIYNNKDSFNSYTLNSIISVETNDKSEEEEISHIENLIKKIEIYENMALDPMNKKQIIYKKEIRGLRSLSKSTAIIQNGSEIKEENESINNLENENQQTDYKIKKNKSKIAHIKKTIVPKTRRIVKFPGTIKINTESESDNEEGNNTRNNTEKYDVINTNNSRQNTDSKTSIDRNKTSDPNTNPGNDKSDTKTDEDEIIIKNKKKKFLILRGNRHYFIKNVEKDEKSTENTYTLIDNEEKNLTHKSRHDIPSENQLFYLKLKDHKNNNSFTQNKNLSKDYLSRNHKNLILYKKKLCNDTRGISISKKINENDNTDKVLHKVSTNYTINGSKIVKIRKYFTNEKKNLSRKKEKSKFKDMSLKKRNINNDFNENNLFNCSDNKKINKNYYKTITYSKSNFDLIDQAKNTCSLNGNVYYKKHRFDNLRNSYCDKSVPRKPNKFLEEIRTEIRKKKYLNNNSIEEKERGKTLNNNTEDNNAENHRYYRINQYNNKKFRLKAPKNYYKS